MDATVLVISNRLHRNLNKVLVEAGLIAKVVQTLPQALQCLRRGNYSAVVIDANRTTLDALELVLNMRDFDARVPIVVFGVLADEANRLALRRQAQLSLVEPRNAEYLARTVAMVGAH